MQKLMTQKERELEARNASIRAQYATMKGQFPDASNWRICGELGKRFHLSAMAIRNITR